MFFTRPEYSEWLPPLEGYKNCSGWGIVEMAVPLPWFLLEICVHDCAGNPAGIRTLLISRVTTLAGALRTMREAPSAQLAPYRVLGFYPPGWDDNTETWSTRDIVEIWDVQIEYARASHDVWLMKFSDGKELLEPNFTPSKPVKKLRQVYSAPAP